jgi:prepilin-type N-terminal cleavage/methylation domain-containing protein
MRKKQGFTLVEIMIVVAIIGLLAAIAIPSFLKARESARRTACINNLRNIDGAKDQYALEFGGSELTMFNHTNLATYIKDTNKCFCPAAQDENRFFFPSYSIEALISNPICMIDMADTPSGNSITNHDIGYSGP